MLFPFFLKGIYKNGKHTRNIWPWLPFVWSNEFIIMSLVFLFGVILLGNSFSQYLLRLSTPDTGLAPEIHSKSDGWAPHTSEDGGAGEAEMTRQWDEGSEGRKTTPGNDISFLSRAHLSCVQDWAEGFRLAWTQRDMSCEPCQPCWTLFSKVWEDTAGF